MFLLIAVGFRKQPTGLLHPAQLPNRHLEVCVITTLKETDNWMIQAHTAGKQT